MSRTPARTLAELDALDTNEIIQGYRDGRDNEPCGDNRSDAYWHGWRNGRVDGGFAAPDDAQRALCALYLAEQRRRIA